MKLKEKLTRYNWRYLFPAPWPAIWLWILLANLILGIAAPESIILGVIRISGILLCLVYTRVVFSKDHLLQLAMLCTFIADLILALSTNFEAGIIVFLVAQIIHAIRLNGEALKRQIIIFSMLATACITVSFFIPGLQAIYVICVFYVTALVTNILISWRWHCYAQTNPHALFALAGFLLFLCCDACTGVSYLAFNQAAPAILYVPANFFAWFFYYPSQILISNSSKYATIKPKGR